MGPATGPEATSSIKVVSDLTSIPMGTLRVWERRYGFPLPARRHGSNRRVYSDDQVQKLRVIASALARGYRPSDVIHKSMAELQGLLGQAVEVLEAARSARGGAALADVSMLLTLLAADDVKGIEDELRLVAAALGAKRFVTELAQPLARAVGEAWAAGTLAIRHEHLMTECLITQMRSLLAHFQEADGGPNIVLATLPGEPHTLGLQMVALYLALSSAKPRLIGANTPPEQVLAAAKALGASVVGIAVTPAADFRTVRPALRKLARELPDSVALWVGGGESKGLPPRAQALATWPAIDVALQRVRTLAQPIGEQSSTRKPFKSLT